MSGTAKKAVTAPEAVRILWEQYGITATLATVRRRIDQLGLGVRLGQYRILEPKEVAKLAKALKDEK